MLDNMKQPLLDKHNPPRFFRRESQTSRRMQPNAGSGLTARLAGYFSGVPRSYSFNFLCNVLRLIPSFAAALVWTLLHASIT